MCLKIWDTDQRRKQKLQVRGPWETASHEARGGIGSQKNLQKSEEKKTISIYVWCSYRLKSLTPSFLQQNAKIEPPIMLILFGNAFTLMSC